MSWIDTFDAVFFVTISTLVCGAVGLVVKYCLKSKCDDINLFYGFIRIHRDVKAEVELEERELELGNNEETKE